MRVTAGIKIDSKGATDGYARHGSLTGGKPETGSKRKGKSMKKNPRVSKSPTLTAEMIAHAVTVDPNAKVRVNKRGHANLLVYYRPIDPSES